jgi:hypothetical protein
MVVPTRALGSIPRSVVDIASNAPTTTPRNSTRFYVLVGILDAPRQAAKVISKLAGYLPLFITLIGRLVSECGAEDQWETTLVEMLKSSECRDSMLGGDKLGANIVGNSLNHVSDQDARDLFLMMAVAAEDVLMPMAVLEATHLWHLRSMRSMMLRTTRWLVAR